MQAAGRQTDRFLAGIQMAGRKLAGRQLAGWLRSIKLACRQAC